MDAYSIDKPACMCGSGLSGVNRQSAGSRDSTAGRSGGRQRSFRTTLGARCSGGKSAGFFPSIEDGSHHSLISRRNISP